MADRPIIFSAPMVRALLAGHKTQTRRLATSPLSKVRAGDRLWVRESSVVYTSQRTGNDYAFHMATDPKARTRVPEGNGTWCRKVCPAIHMPRWASRLTLVVTETRRQKLQDISEADAIAEGAANGFWFDGRHVLAGSTARGAFWCLWTLLNSVQSWDANPDIVALTFAVHQCNIDTLEAAHG